MLSPSIRFTRTSFAWPDGTAVLAATTAAFGPGRTGLVGDNGAGKTTVLRLILGELTPTEGSIEVFGEIGHLPQHLTLATDALVADLLGISGTLAALAAIEAGDTTPALFDAVADRWDIHARARATLDRIGLGGLSLDRPVGTVSGGEAMLVRLAGLQLAATPVVLLDEPTNNLDRAARERFYEAITGWRGALVVVSHDIDLLDLMDETVELHHGQLEVYGGGYTDYAEALAQEQTAAAQALRSVEADLLATQRQRRAAETTLARRARYAKTQRANNRMPKIVMNTRRSQAQESAGRLRDSLDERVESARGAVVEQEARLRDDDRVRITLPDPGVPAGRGLVELHHPAGVIRLAGPERVAVTGPNGIGKTRLLESLFDERLSEGRPTYAVPLTHAVGYLPQRLDGLDDSASALDNVRAVATRTPPGDLRAALARFLIRGDDAHRPVATLSGGERFRVALARLLLADPPHQLLVLDEPTNNLDLTTRAALIDSMRTYRGGILLVSHDHHLLEAIGLDLLLELDEEGTLRVLPELTTSSPPRHQGQLG